MVAMMDPLPPWSSQQMAFLSIAPSSTSVISLMKCDFARKMVEAWLHN